MGSDSPVPPRVSPACPWSRLTMGEAKRHCVDGAHTSARGTSRNRPGAVVWGALCQPFPPRPRLHGVGEESGCCLALCSCCSPDRKRNTPGGHAFMPTQTHSGRFPAIFVPASGPLSSPGPLLKSLESHGMGRKPCFAARQQPQLPDAGDQGRQRAESRRSSRCARSSVLQAARPSCKEAFPHSTNVLY